MVDPSQMMRGTLEGCIIKIISKNETYGYDIVSKLKEYGFTDAKEGTIYPLLVRLERKNLITAKYKESPLGPKRKHYYLTSLGEDYLYEFLEIWRDVRNSVDRIMEEVK
ncbi:MAG: PadR family transcriptional regulator [Bacillota bacterium]|nr:PadR family transcriptional regulator [Bacillota bacterium]